MSKNPGTNPFGVFLGLDGRPLNGGEVFIGVANEDPETDPQQVWWDAAGTISAAQPLETLSGYVVNGNNVARFWVDTNSYSIRVRDRLGNEVFYSAEVVTELPDGVVTADSIASGATALKAIADKVDPYSFNRITRYGACGEGNDDTAVFNAAAGALQNGWPLYIPAGTYLIDSAAFLIRGKSNFRIFGDGAATRIIVSGQDDSTTKTDWHTTFAIDECEDFTIENMVVESRGVNWGNTDAYSGLGTGDPRTNAIIDYGGSALAVLRSARGTLRNIIARRCGSVGVVYLSSCEDMVVEDSFANARSLGYAGFCADNWAEAAVNTKRNYKFVNCRVAKEDATYSSKAGLVLEGDQITGRLLNVEVQGGVFEDSAIGSDAPTYGAGIVASEVRLLVTGAITKNCYIGLRWQKGGGAVDFSWMHVSGAQFINNGVTGMYVSVGTATGGVNMSVAGGTITSNSTSVWSALSDNTVNKSSGIVADVIGGDLLKIDGCDISGGQYGVHSTATTATKFSISGGNIEGTEAAVYGRGGGTLRINGGEYTAPAPVYFSTLNAAADGSGETELIVTGATINTAADTASDNAILLTGNSSLFLTTRVKGNLINGGVINAPQGSATTYDVDEVMLSVSRMVSNTGLSGPNTIFEINIPKEFLPSYTYAKGTDGTARAIIAQTNNQGGTRGLTRFTLTGDVRTNYQSSSNAIIEFVA